MFKIGSFTTVILVSDNNCMRKLDEGISEDGLVGSEPLSQHWLLGSVFVIYFLLPSQSARRACLPHFPRLCPSGYGAQTCCLAECLHPIQLGLLLIHGPLLPSGRLKKLTHMNWSMSRSAVSKLVVQEKEWFKFQSTSQGIQDWRRAFPFESKDRKKLASQLKAVRKKDCPLHKLLLFYSSLQLIGWGPPTSRNVIGFTQSTIPMVFLSRNTQNHIWPINPTPHGPVRLT